MVYRFGALADEYATNWTRLRIRVERVQGFNALAKKLKTRIPRYKPVSDATGVPMALIAVLHEREASGDFSTYLGNGQPWNRRTTIVPIGVGPFASFEDGAIDAIRRQGLHKVLEWSIERALFEAERWNGFGYRNRGLRSPYLWGGTNLQQPGKFVRDGLFDPNVTDTQPGCAPMLYALFALDRTLALPLLGEAPEISMTPAMPIPPKPRPRPLPSQPGPAFQRWGIIGAIGMAVAAILSLVQGWFNAVGQWLHATFPYWF